MSLPPPPPNIPSPPLAALPPPAIPVHDIEEWFRQGTRIALKVPLPGQEHSQTHEIFISVHILGPHDNKAESSLPAQDEVEWITFLHGFPTCSFDFCGILYTLLPPQAPRPFRLLLWDYYGYGDSDKTPGLPPDHSIHLLADLQIALWRHLGITHSTHIICHDVGDTVAQELLARWQEGSLSAPRLDKILLFNGGLCPALHRPVLMQRLLLNPFLGPVVTYLMNEMSFSRSLAQVFGKDSQPTNEEVHQHWKGVMNREGWRNYHILIRYILDRRQYQDRWEGSLLWHIQQQDQKEKKGGGSASTSGQDVDVLFLWGMQDPVSGAHAAQEIYRRFDSLQGWKILERHDVGHFPMLEDVQGVASEVVRFFSSS